MNVNYTPPEVLVIPLYRRPLFPGTFTPIMIQEADFIEALNEIKTSNAPYVGIFLVQEEHGDAPITDLAQIHNVGVLASVASIAVQSDQAPPAANAAAATSAAGQRRPPGSPPPPPPPPPMPEDAARRRRPGATGPVREEPTTPSAPAAGEKPAAGSGAATAGADSNSARPRAGSFAWVYVSGVRRVRVVSRVANKKWLTVKIEPLKDEAYDPKDPELRAYHQEIVQTIKDVMQATPTPLFKEMLTALLHQLDPSNPSQLADISACVTSARGSDLQEVLEALDVKLRQKRALALLKDELKVAQLQQKMNRDIEQKVSQQQQRYFLNEQMKSIKRELGLETDEKETLLTKFKGRLAKLKVPDAVMKTIDEEMQKLSTTEPASTEFAVTRNYLDWLTQLPWGVSSTDKLSLAHAAAVLDEDHYGLKDLKERILEFIAVGSLRGLVSGKILCLVGPPGVGKTSIGKSVARALDRKFFRFSVGGLSDVAEIKGHRRTYVGSMPGKLIQCLKQVAVENPVILIDEIDKMSRGVHGDPASALLEVLDPEQNASFADHYLDVPFDLSRVLFICTANVTDTIPGPLLDRMEVLRISGYVTDEKVEIARKYLLPHALETNGLKRSQLSVTIGAIRALTKQYCREAGVRSLQQHIDRITRKAALRVVRAREAAATTATTATTAATTTTTTTAAAAASAADDVLGMLDRATTIDAAEPAPVVATETPATPAAATAVADKDQRVVVSEENLKDFVGLPQFTTDRYYKRTPVGVVMGLAWTSMGGATMYVEVLKDQFTKGNSIQISGSVGDVMRESAQLSHTFAKHFLRAQKGENKFFEENAVHLHVPEGATPKDGPSAGVTMITALLSAATQKPVRPNLAMSGEITLTGKVLPVGGIKEKTIAARRSGVKMLLFPRNNKKDWDELDASITQGLDVHFVDTYDDVFKIAFKTDEAVSGSSGGGADDVDTDDAGDAATNNTPA
jgi:Lon-like ATP-dependent protease